MSRAYMTDQGGWKAKDTAVGVPEGYVLVPAEATPDMIQAARQAAMNSGISRAALFDEDISDTYRAMIAAAPQQPAAVDGLAARLVDELAELVEAARLLGVTQAKKLFGCHTDEDRRFERAMYESIDKHRAALLDWEAKQPAPQQSEPQGTKA